MERRPQFQSSHSRRPGDQASRANRRLLATIAVAITSTFASACSGESPGTPTNPSSRVVAGLVRCSPPKGWEVEEYANGVDPVVAFVDGVDRIAVRAFGAPGTAFATEAAYLRGPAASTMGRPPEAIGTVTVAGQSLTLYAHRFPIHLGDPHSPAPPTMFGREVFCVLPAAGGRFVAFTWARESPAPDLEHRPDAVWEAFLKSIELVDAGR